MSDLLPCVEVGPGRDAHASIVWRHGLGADGPDFEPLVPEFGLPDVHGNVSEWCSGEMFNYSGVPEPADRAQVRTRVARGGNYRSALVTSRPTWRGFAANEAFTDPTTGLRPSREIDP